MAQAAYLVDSVAPGDTRPAQESICIYMHTFPRGASQGPPEAFRTQGPPETFRSPKACGTHGPPEAFPPEVLRPPEACGIHPVRRPRGDLLRRKVACSPSIRTHLT